MKCCEICHRVVDTQSENGDCYMLLVIDNGKYKLNKMNDGEFVHKECVQDAASEYGNRGSY
jgi:hypothetical protein